MSQILVLNSRKQPAEILVPGSQEGDMGIKANRGIYGYDIRID